MKGSNAASIRLPSPFSKGIRLLGRGCLLLDVQMDGMTGLELQEEMIRRGITLPIVFLSAHGDLDMAVDAMRRGACAFIQKTADRARLLQAIVDAMAKSRGAVGDSTPGALVAAWNTLTDREKEVAKLVAEGLLNREVGGTPRRHCCEDGAGAPKRSLQQAWR